MYTFIILTEVLIVYPDVYIFCQWSISDSLVTLLDVCEFKVYKILPWSSLFDLHDEEQYMNRR